MKKHCVLGRMEHSAPKANLYVFPHSGGMPGTYMQWKRELNEVNVFGVQYPGRGSRISEPPCQTLDGIVSDVLANGEFVSPYILFGHSLGAIVAYEVATRVSGSNPPLALIVSAMSGPQFEVVKPGSSQLAAEELIARVEADTRATLAASTELRDLFIDLFRNDLRAAESYVWKRDRLLTIPIVFMGGSEDSILDNERLGWGRCTSARFESRLFQGGHFYFRESSAAFFEALNEIVGNVSRSGVHSAAMSNG